MAEGGGVSIFIDNLAVPGIVTQVVSSTQFVCSNVAGFKNSQFAGYYVWVISKNDGSSSGPKGENPSLISAFIGSGGTGTKGTITFAGFTASLSVGDQVLLITPMVANAIIGLAVPAADSADNVLERDVIGNKTDTTAGSSLFSADKRKLFELSVPWSAYQLQAALSTVAGDINLPSVTVAGLPAGATIEHALLHVKFQDVIDSSGAANSLSGAQYIQISADAGATWHNAIALIDGIYATDASSHGQSDVMMGNIDISSIVTGNGTFQVKWAQALSIGSDLTFKTIQAKLQIWYSV